MWHYWKRERLLSLGRACHGANGNFLGPSDGGGTASSVCRGRLGRCLRADMGNRDERDEAAAFSREPSELTQRYEESYRRVLVGHPRSEREAFADLAYKAVMSYRASRSALVNERICAGVGSLTNGDALNAALNDIDAHVASLKEQLIDEVWSAVDPAMADKLTAYAKAAQPLVWESSPAFFSDWTEPEVAKAIGELCLASRVSPSIPRSQAPRPPFGASD